MDTFMDKLAQKLNAQEMIRANTAADAEEMARLKNQITEYNACLEKLKKLLAEGESKLAGAQVNGAEIDKLVEESLAKIREIQADTQALEELKQQLTEKINASGETVHKECVKVYRNVQAVVVEENAKQTAEVEAALQDAVRPINGKVKAVLGIAIASLVLSLGSVVLQVLAMMNFKFF